MFWTRTGSFAPRAAFRNQLDLFNRFIGSGAGADASQAFPAFNVWANDDGAAVTSELPGVRMDDLDITVSGKRIVIKGTRKDSEGSGVRYMRRERPAGDFSRSFEMPFQIDAGRVSARLNQGVLQVDLPRAEVDKPRKIVVNAG